jgi:two-component system, NarL family, response regulator LiaR
VSETRRDEPARRVTPIRVLLIDDQQMLIEALAASLSTTPDIVVVGHCRTQDPRPEVLAALLCPDVITIEVAQAHDATTLLTLLRAACPPARIVVLTASGDPQQALEAARAGADGWVPKQSSLDVLAHALRCAGQGQSYFPPEQLGAVLRELRADVGRAQVGRAQVGRAQRAEAGRAQRQEGPLDVLTRRERDVLMCLEQGQGLAEIAGELGMSANTVRTHTNKIFAKLRVHSRLEAATVARQALRDTRPPPMSVPIALSMQEPATRASP